MADDRKDSDEYEYPSEEYYKGGEYIPPEEPPEPGSPGPGNFKSRRLFLIIGLLLAIGIVYLILMYTARRSSNLAQPTPTVDTGAAAIPSAGSAPQVLTTPQAPPPQDNATIARLMQQNQANQQVMTQLQGQIQQLQSQISDMTNAISTLNNRVQVMANEIQAIGTDRSLQGRTLPSLPRGEMYNLKALMPGRAWIQTKGGHVTTVSIGDRLPGYGIIQMINTEQGIVTTSSGAIIQYGPKDS